MRIMSGSCPTLAKATIPGKPPKENDAPPPLLSVWFAATPLDNSLRPARQIAMKENASFVVLRSPSESCCF